MSNEYEDDGAFQLAVWEICKDLSKKYDVTFSYEFINYMSELTFEAVSQISGKLEYFAKHGKRSVITIEDIKLYFRTSTDLIEVINNAKERSENLEKERSDNLEKERSGNLEKGSDSSSSLNHIGVVNNAKEKSNNLEKGSDSKSDSSSSLNHATVAVKRKRTPKCGNPSKVPKRKSSRHIRLKAKNVDVDVITSDTAELSLDAVATVAVKRGMPPTKGNPKVPKRKSSHHIQLKVKNVDTDVITSNAAKLQKSPSKLRKRTPVHYAEVHTDSTINTE